MRTLLATMITLSAAIQGCAVEPAEEPVGQGSESAYTSEPAAPTVVKVGYVFAPTTLKTSGDSLVLTLEARLPAADFSKTAGMAPLIISEEGSGAVPPKVNYSVELVTPNGGCEHLPRFSLSTWSHNVHVLTSARQSNTACAAFIQKLATEGATWRIRETQRVWWRSPLTWEVRIAPAAPEAPAAP